MLIAVTDFGSVWRRRFGKNDCDPRRFARAVYYNTTGVRISGAIRQRPRIIGYARFHACGGFDANHPARMIDQVFDCSDPCVWNGNNKLLFKRVLPRAEQPDMFLVVARAERTGKLSIGIKGWRSPGSWLISFSECGGQQEAMLLLPVHGWIRSELGKLVLEPDATRPWVARLELTAAQQE